MNNRGGLINQIDEVNKEINRLENEREKIIGEKISRLSNIYILFVIEIYNKEFKKNKLSTNKVACMVSYSDLLIEALSTSNVRTNIKNDNN